LQQLLPQSGGREITGSSPATAWPGKKDNRLPIGQSVCTGSAKEKTLTQDCLYRKGRFSATFYFYICDENYNLLVSASPTPHFLCRG